MPGKQKSGEQGEDIKKTSDSKDTYHDAIFVFNSEDEDGEGDDGNEECDDI